MNTLIQAIRNRYAKDLPEQLESQAVVISNSCTVAKIVRTNNYNNLGERLYRLRYIYKFASGGVYELKSHQPVIENNRKGQPVIVGYGWTRDQLTEKGCRYIRHADAKLSQVLEYVPIFEGSQS